MFTQTARDIDYRSVEDLVSYSQSLQYEVEYVNSIVENIPGILEGVFEDLLVGRNPSTEPRLQGEAVSWNLATAKVEWDGSPAQWGYRLYSEAKRIVADSVAEFLDALDLEGDADEIAETIWAQFYKLSD